MLRPVTCLLKTVLREGVHDGVGMCNKTFKVLQNKDGKIFHEVLFDYGNNLTRRAEVFPNEIINYNANGDITRYTKDLLHTIVNENDKIYIQDVGLFDKIRNMIFKGL